MSNPNPTPAGQDPAPGDPQAGAPTPTPATTPTPKPPAPAQATPPAPAPGQVFDAVYVQTLRGEAADYRVKHKEAVTALTAAQEKAAALEAQVKTFVLQSAIATAETKVADPEVALKLIDQSKLKFNEQGAPENLNDLLKELVEQKPYLAAGPGVGPTPASNPARAGAKYTLEQVKAMTPDEINANWDAVQEVLKGG